MIHATITDDAALGSISSDSLRAYLPLHGWREAETWADRATVYAIEHDGRTWEIFIPLLDTVADYVSNIARSISLLSEIEQRSQIDVFYDVSAAAADVIRLAALEQPRSRKLSLHQTSHLHEDAYELLAAAARAAEMPRPAYRGRKSEHVARFLDHLTPVPGDFERFALTLHSPVPAQFGPHDMFSGDREKPFSRRASETLASALQALQTAISESRKAKDLGPFDSAVPAGVSANLCSAVAKLTEHAAEHGDTVMIAVNWAAVRPASTVPASRFPFRKHTFDLLENAAVHLRSGASYLDEHVVAEVVRLEREPKDFDGRATLLAELDNRTRRVDVEFAKADYQAAIEAHDQKLPIELDGDLHPAGRVYELRNPRNVRLLNGGPG